MGEYTAFGQAVQPKDWRFHRRGTVGNLLPNMTYHKTPTVTDCRGSFAGV